MTQRIIQYLILSLVVTIVTFGLLEISLRFIPGVIPTPVLIRFNDVLRSQIATDRGFMTEDLTYVYERDDNGPELRIPIPNVDFSYPEIFAFDNDVGVELSATMDEIGFCNPSGLYSNTDTFDVVTVGDSLTWCHTVKTEDTFSYLLAEQSGKSVVNLGKGGVGLYEYLQILRGFGLQKRPQVVFLNVYEGNDLRDAVEYWQVANREFDEITEPDSAAIGIRDSLRDSSLGERSYSLNLLLAGASYAYSYYAYPEERAGETIDFGYLVKINDRTVEFNSRNLDVDEVLYAKQLAAGQIDLNMFTSALEEFVSLSLVHDFLPVVTYIPSAHTAYADRISFDDSSLEELLGQFSADMRQYFDLTGRLLGYEFIDLTPDLQAAAREIDSDKLLYFPTNLHLTQVGHEVISSRLLKVLPRELK